MNYHKNSCKKLPLKFITDSWENGIHATSETAKEVVK